jgi:hypothetical protein
MILLISAIKTLNMLARVYAVSSGYKKYRDVKEKPSK